MGRPRNSCDEGASYPQVAAISTGQFLSEFGRWWLKAGIPGGFTVTYPESLAETHCRNSRRYAQVAILEHGFEFAPQVLTLPKIFRSGLICHEIGHVLAGPGTSEDAADLASMDVLGVRIDYDRRWPGKGLQRGVVIS